MRQINDRVIVIFEQIWGSGIHQKEFFSVIRRQYQRCSSQHWAFKSFELTSSFLDSFRDLVRFYSQLIFFLLCNFQPAQNLLLLPRRSENLWFFQSFLENFAVVKNVQFVEVFQHTMQIGDSNETKSTKNGFSDRGSIFSGGGESQLSNFTSCTNPTFDPVHRVWK